MIFPLIFANHEICPCKTYFCSWCCRRTNLTLFSFTAWCRRFLWGFFSKRRYRPDTNAKEIFLIWVCDWFHIVMGLVLIFFQGWESTSLDDRNHDECTLFSAFHLWIFLTKESKYLFWGVRGYYGWDFCWRVRNSFCVNFIELCWRGDRNLVEIGEDCVNFLGSSCLCIWDNFINIINLFLILVQQLIPISICRVPNEFYPLEHVSQASQPSCRSVTGTPHQCRDEADC